MYRAIGRYRRPKHRKSLISLNRTGNLQGGSKNKLLILSECVNKTEKIGGM